MFFKKSKSKIVTIEGMNSYESAKKIEDTLNNLIDVSKIKINLAKGQVIVSYYDTIDEILLTKKLEELGFNVTGIKE